MRAFSLGLGLLLLPAMAGAQVVIHQAALDQLAGIRPAPAAVAVPAPVIRHVARRVIHRRVAGATAVAFQAPPPLPDLTPHPSPVVQAAARPAAPAAAAPMAARPVPVLVRPAPAPAVPVHFASGSAELPANTATLLKPICAAAEPSGTVSIAAPAPGVAGDPSVAMRLSMQRAFAIRDALTKCGVSPSRIIPRAVGAVGTDLDTAQISLGRP